MFSFGRNSRKEAAPSVPGGNRGNDGPNAGAFNRQDRAAASVQRVTPSSTSSRPFERGSSVPSRFDQVVVEPHDPNDLDSVPPQRRGEPDSTGFEDSTPADATSGVIRTIADFPPIKGVMTATDSAEPALRVPLELKDLIIGVQFDARRGGVFIEPTAQSKVLKYVSTILSGLTAAGISAGARARYADTSVIAAIRKSHERSSDRRGGGIGSKSAGAQLAREWIGIAHSERATDLHVRIIDGGKAKVQIRVNGALENMPGVQDGLVTEGDAMNVLKSSYEVLSDKNTNNTGTYSPTTTLSSMIDAALGISNLRVRYASVRGLHGPKCVMRLLPTSALGGMTFEQMGFAESHIELFERSQAMESGGVGFLGVTGSGKTTAAKAYVETHPGRSRAAFYQVADPIEYPIMDMHQIYVQRDLVTVAKEGEKDAYSEVMESLLRLDPELVDVGEVRDLLSARAMANVAKSGHMSMFTLHVPDIKGVFSRLTDPKLGLSREELTSGEMLALLCYQSLVPVVCPKCAFDLPGMMDYLKQEFRAEAQREARDITNVVTALTTKHGFDPAMLRYRNPCGCAHCKGRGTTGLTILAEVAMPEPTWLEFAATNREREAMTWWRQTYSDRNVFSGNQQGKLVIEHAMYKASKGLIDPRVIEKYGQLRALEAI